MHIAVEGLGNRSGGGATVLRALVDSARRHRRVEQLTVFAPPRKDREFDLGDDNRVRVIEMPAADRNIAVRAWWLQRGWARACRNIGADVALSLNGMGVERGLPTAVFVQQPMPFHAEALALFPLSTRVRSVLQKALMRRACRAASRIIVQTTDMRKRVAGSFSIDEDRFSVVTPGVALAPYSEIPASVRPMCNSPAGGRLLYVGSSSRHKNVEFLIDAMPGLKARVPDAQLFLTWPTDHPAGAREGVTCLGWLNPTEVAAAYGEATLLCMPSLAETLGLPQLEAMAAGTAVLAADRPYAHAVCGDAARFFDPLDRSDFVLRAAALLQDAEARSALTDLGKARVAELDRSDPYSRMLDIVADLAGAGRMQPR